MQDAQPLTSAPAAAQEGDLPVGAAPRREPERPAPPRPTSGRRPRYDVVFYTPTIGPLLGQGATPTAGGAERQVLLLSRELARRGLRVAVVAFALDGLPDRSEGVDVIVRPSYRRRRGVVGKADELLRIVGSLGRARSRVIVKRGAGFDLAVIGLYARATRTRLLFSAASLVDFDYEQIDSSRRNLILYKLGVALASSIVVQSEEQAEACRRYFGREPTLIRSVAVLPDQAVNVPTAFLWIGRIVSYKRPLAYIELARSLPQARFRMVAVSAPGSAGDRLRAAVRTAAAEVGNLELLAPRPHADLMKLVSEAVAVVSTSDFEGMPNTFLEAWSRGAPAMALAHDPDGVITRHRLGTFAGGSAKVLAEQAELLWRDRWARQDLSRRCRHYVAAEHSVGAVAEMWANELGRDARHRARRRAHVSQRGARCVE